MQTTCPDHWDVVNDSVTGKPYCKRPNDNNVNRGKDTDGKTTIEAAASGYDSAKGFDFSNSGWSSAGTAVCAKKKWADTYGVYWDTVTNANFC